MRTRRLILAGAVVIALGSFTSTPAFATPASATPVSAAKASTRQTISGAVKEDAPGAWSLGGQKYRNRLAGKLEVYTSGCARVKRAHVKWAGTKFTISGLKAGRYRILYRDLTGRTTASAPYGLSTGTWFGGGPDCRSSAIVSLRSGKKLTGKNLTVHARGGLQSTGAGLQSTADHTDRYRIYAAKSGRAVAWSVSDDSIAMLAPGSYRVAMVRTKTSTGKSVVLRVFGASGTKVSRGRILEVSAARVLRFDFASGAKRSFAVPRLPILVPQLVSSKSGDGLIALDPGGAHLRGARVGDALQVVPAQSRPRASRVAFQWRLAGSSTVIATGETLTLAAKYAGKTVSVTGDYGRTGYLGRTAVTSIVIDGTNGAPTLPTMRLMSPQTLEGDLGAAPSDADYDYVTYASGLVALNEQATFVDAQQQPLVVEDPPGCVWTRLDGYVPNEEIRSDSCMLGSNYLSTLVGQRIRFTVTYSTSGYQDFAITTTFLVEAG
ncbi:MAG: hypothetical protein J0H64_01650 [Actinobacteria bacterium]|nr:hypothetical protein [Actinomycetota bacterium]